MKKLIIGLLIIIGLCLFVACDDIEGGIDKDTNPISSITTYQL